MNCMIAGRAVLQTMTRLSPPATQAIPPRPYIRLKGRVKILIRCVAIAFAVVIHNKRLGLSFGKIATLLCQQYDLTVAPSGVVHAVHRTARQARPDLYRPVRTDSRRC